MAEAKDAHAWQHTSAVLAMIRNVQVKDKADMVTPSQLNPYIAKKAKQPTIRDFCETYANPSKKLDVSTHGR